ncbi:MAG: helix-turn-helix transcriptional regulator [Sulfuricurvum sp.]|nr:helix-turn-helix transcriptional regulator [Sulfuricurvum sp.]
MRFSLLSDTAIQIELGKRVDIKRRENGLSLEDLRDKSGVSISTITRMVEGKSSPSLINFIKVLRALGELDKLNILLESDNTFRPSGLNAAEPKKRIFKSKKTTAIQWGDEE